MRALDFLDARGTMGSPLENGAGLKPGSAVAFHKVYRSVRLTREGGTQLWASRTGRFFAARAPNTPKMSIDVEMMKSAMSLAAGVLGFCSALLAFINSRLQAATTAEARKRLYSSLLSVVHLLTVCGAAVCWVVFSAPGVGVAFMVVAFLLQALQFLWFPTARWRVEVVALVGVGFGVSVLVGSVQLTEFSGRLTKALTSQKAP